jgi:hypothetical protein
MKGVLGLLFRANRVERKQLEPITRSLLARSSRRFNFAFRTPHLTNRSTRSSFPILIDCNVLIPSNFANLCRLPLEANG